MNYSSPYVTNVVANAPDYVRAEFIRKVYNLFFASILLTVGAGWFCAQPAVAPVVWGLRLPLMLVGLGLVFAMSWSRKTNGLNLIMLFAFASIWGAILGPLVVLAERFAPGVGTQAGLITVATFGGLTAYVWTTKKDFNYLGGMLWAGLVGLLVAGFVMMFFHTPLMSMIYAVVGILIFCGYVLYDTSAIMNRLTPNEAVTGALDLYLDFINLFILILRLLSEVNRR